MARDIPDSYPVHTEEWPTHQSWSDNKPRPDSDSDGNDDGDSNGKGDGDSNPRQAQQHTAPATIRSSLPSEIVPARFYSKVPKPSQCGHDTEAYISALKDKVAVLCQENAKLAAHAILAFDHMQGLKCHMNAKGPSSKRKKLNTDSRWLNLEEGLLQCKKQEAEEQEKVAQEQMQAEAR